MTPDEWKAVVAALALLKTGIDASQTLIKSLSKGRVASKSDDQLLDILLKGFVQLTENENHVFELLGNLVKNFDVRGDTIKMLVDEATAKTDMIETIKNTLDINRELLTKMNERIAAIETQIAGK